MAESIKNGTIAPNVRSLEQYRDAQKTGGGKGGPPVDSETQRYIDARIEATRAQNDARFAEVLTKIDALNPATWQQNALALVGTVVAGVLALVSIAAFSADRFDAGVSSMGAVEEAIDQQRETNLEQNARIDRLIELMEERRAESEASPE